MAKSQDRGNKEKKKPKADANKKKGGLPPHLQRQGQTSLNINPGQIKR
jgi:hypothetical protein